jgi:hypothetical protein
MCICLIYKYSTYGTLEPQPDLGRPSRVKPSQASIIEALRLKGNLKQSTSGKRPGFICSNANDVLAAQVCTNQQTLIDERIT